jgi:hypothetical protein
MMSTKQTAIPEGTNDMNTDHSLQSREGAQVNSTRKIALVAGVLFVITFITSIPAQLLLYRMGVSPEAAMVRLLYRAV